MEIDKVISLGAWSEFWLQMNDSIPRQFDNPDLQVSGDHANFCEAYANGDQDALDVMILYITWKLRS